ncbi:hypothetical protein FA13DRAFT_1813570 [Coprinellus micaceus]|uniref:F-box domain-containing protein n=1 Tax=Coprinellus micaceus TaxID=71717 RepID=A0A4Y7TDH5_COPMI|nr:hypothetical protein FA13DRAFT_1813570 [Coprinellus micaceus]
MDSNLRFFKGEEWSAEVPLTLEELVTPASQRIPLEILHDILHPLRPIFDVCSPSVLGSSVFSSRQNDFAVYLMDMKHFLSLRFVSRIWNAVMVPIVYEEFVIPTRFPVMRPVMYGQVPSLLPTLINSGLTNPYGPVHKLVNFLRGDGGLVDTLADNMKTLMLYDFCHPFSSHDYSDENNLMTRIIKKFQWSDIQTLHCYGRETYAFRYPGWVQDTLPNLPSTIQSLSFDAVDRRTISCALVDLGSAVQFLEIRNRSRLWDLDYESLGEASFHLPTEMPMLETLRLIHISTTLSEFTKLLSRIGAYPRPSNTADVLHTGGLQSTLRSLMITQLFVLNEDPHVGGFYAPLTAVEFSQLLDINGIADGLTYLYVGPGLYSMSDAFNVIWRPDIVTEIVQKCSRLISFSYTSIVDESLVDHLPPDLRHISLALRPSLPPSHIISYLDSLPMFTDFVKRSLRREQKLGSLKILVMDQLQRNPGFWRMSFDDVRGLLQSGRSELEKTCEDGGIELSFDLI